MRLAIFSFAVSGSLLLAPAPLAAQTKEAGKEPAKRFVVPAESRTWLETFQWLCDASGRMYMSNIPPPDGKVRLVSPHPDKKCKIDEIVDLINDELLAHDWNLLLRTTSFTLAPVGRRMPELPKRYPVEEWDDLPKTTITSHVTQLRCVPVDDVAPEVKKLLGPFGEVYPLTGCNQLVIQDTIGNLRKVLAKLAEIDSLPERRRRFEAIEVLRLENGADGQGIVAALKATFGGACRQGLHIELDALHNAVIAGGSREQVRQIKFLLAPWLQ